MPQTKQCDGPVTRFSVPWRKGRFLNGPEILSKHTPFGIHDATFEAWIPPLRRRQRPATDVARKPTPRANRFAGQVFARSVRVIAIEEEVFGHAMESTKQREARQKHAVAAHVWAHARSFAQLTGAHHAIQLVRAMKTVIGGHQSPQALGRIGMFESELVVVLHDNV